MNTNFKTIELVPMKEEAILFLPEKRLRETGAKSSFAEQYMCRSKGRC
jgi:hypothetical protein